MANDAETMKAQSLERAAKRDVMSAVEHLTEAARAWQRSAAADRDHMASCCEAQGEMLMALAEVLTS